jgi:hypothetical protein
MAQSAAPPARSRSPFGKRAPGPLLPQPEQALVPAWAALLRKAEDAGTLQVAEPEPGVVMFAWYYDKFGVHELGASARDATALMEYQPKLRMRESRADSARKEKMKAMASDYYFRYRMFRLEEGADPEAPQPRNFSTWDLPIELKRWVYHEVVKCYLYVDRERLVKRLYDRLDASGFRAPSAVKRARRSNRIRAKGPDGATRSFNITRALRSIGFEGFGFEEAVGVEVARGSGGRLPPLNASPVELRRALEGDTYLENEGLWEEHGPPALRPAMLALVRAADREQKKQVDDRGTVVLLAYPLKSSGARERRACFYDAIRAVRGLHPDQMRGKFFQFPPSAEPPEDLYVTHVVNEWVDDRQARGLVEDGKVHLVQWVDAKAMAREVLGGFSRIGVAASTGPKTAQLRQRVLLVDGEGRKPFDLSYGAQLIAQFGYSFDQAVDLSVIKAFLKVEGA